MPPTQQAGSATASPPPEAGPTWKPNPGPQELCLSIPGNVFEILYGGARGGGKTDAGIYWLVKPVNELGGKQLISHPLYRALVLRRNANDLTDWIDRAERVFAVYGGVMRDRQKAPVFVFPSGAKIFLGHLKDEDAYTKYQGHEYQRMLIEELTQIKSELLYTKLISSCRSTVKELRPQILMTTNPGGRGHGWVRRRFVSVVPPNTFFKNKATKRAAIFIPSKVDDNPFLMDADPEYVQQLEGIKEIDEKLYKAWRHGEWDAFEGQVFSEWSYGKHTFKTPWYPLERCERIASFDWGYRAPASMHWTARVPKNVKGVEHLLTYREIYKTNLTPRQWGEIMARVHMVDPIDYIVLPHDGFSSAKGEMTIAEEFEAAFERHGLSVLIVRGQTLVRGARRNRLGLAHSALSMSPDGFPYWMIHQSCLNLIRTLPELPYSETDIEDVDTDAEDHAYDSVTLGLMTLKPNFETGGLAQMNRPRQPQPGTKPAWQQSAGGETQPDDILQSLATPSHARTNDGEF